MKVSQKGFSVVEVLLFFVIVGLVGGIGRYVLSQNKSKDSTADTQSQSQHASEEELEKPLAFDPQGDIVKQNQKETIQKLTFTSPAGWQRIIESDNEWATYSSPDFKGVQFANGSSVTEGGEFYVGAYKQDEDKSIRQMAQEEAISYFTVRGYTLIDNIEAVEGNCGHFGRAKCLGAVYEGYYYEMGYRQVDENVKDSNTPDNKYGKDFTALVESLKFE